ncbi:MAG: serine hydrolase domain-containing protein [Saprospiraceae bacterium]|nr:serine hydrolase domain-containing protein [Saprospiraceae bacterium]
MKYRILILIALAGFSSLHSQDWEMVEKYVQPLVASNNFAGVVLISRAGEVVYHHAFGQADAESGVEHTPASVFQIASVSKPFTATAVMALVEEGKLALADPLSKFVPDHTRGDAITLHHLLTHTSGIPNVNGLPVYHALEQQTNDLPGLITHFKHLPLRFEPGERYGYSNSNYNLLAYIVEEVSGQNFGEFLSTRFFAPLGMDHTGHPGRHPREQVSIVPGYEAVGVNDKQRARQINWSVKTGNGSLYSTTHDLHRWTQAFLSGQVVSPESRDQMLTEHTDNVGYGWFIRPRHDRPQFHINGRSPGYTAVISVYPQEELCIIILSNNYVPVPTQMSIDIAGIMFGMPVEPPIAGDGSVPPDVAPQVSGGYQFGPDFYRPNQLLQVREEEGYLMVDWGVLLYQSGMRFINRPFWSDVEFVKEDGDWVMKYDAFTGLSVDQ